MKLLLTAFDPFGGERINPAQVAGKDRPSMPLEDIVKGIETAIAVIGETETDIHVPKGRTH